MERPQYSSRRRPLFAFAVGLVGVALGLVVGEFVVRAANVAPQISEVAAERYRLSDNLLIGYEPDPKRAGRGYNRLGFRDTDHPKQKPQGTFRIVVIGDSISVGSGISRMRYVFPSLVEKKLRHAGKKVEVINLGVHGYNTQQEVETLRVKGLQFEPDLVLLQCTDNDFRSASHITPILRKRWRRKSGFHSSAFIPYLDKSALYRLLHNWLSPETLKAAKIARETSFDELGQNTVGPSLDKLRQLSVDRGFQVMLAVFPPFNTSAGRVVSPPPFAKDWRTFLRNRSRNNGFAHLDLTRAFVRCQNASKAPLFLDRVHPARPGHECAAQEITRFMLATRVVK